MVWTGDDKLCIKKQKMDAADNKIFFLGKTCCIQMSER